MIILYIWSYDMIWYYIISYDIISHDIYDHIYIYDYFVFSFLGHSHFFVGVCAEVFSSSGYFSNAILHLGENQYYNAVGWAQWLTPGCPKTNKSQSMCIWLLGNASSAYCGNTWQSAATIRASSSCQRSAAWNSTGWGRISFAGYLLDIFSIFMCSMWLLGSSTSPSGRDIYPRIVSTPRVSCLNGSCKWQKCPLFSSVHGRQCHCSIQWSPRPHWWHSMQRFALWGGAHFKTKHPFRIVFVVNVSTTEVTYSLYWGDRYLIR